MKILITGGAGFIASSLADKLAEDHNNEITIVDNLLTGHKEFVPKNSNVSFIKCDVNSFQDISGVFYKGSFDYVFHYAAMVGVQRTLKNPVRVLADIEGIKNILNLSKNTGVRRVFYSSSSEVYGEPVEIPQNEKTTPLNSRLPYAIVKNLGEAYLKAYQQEYGLEYTIFRFFNTYGPKQSMDFVISRFVRAALNAEPIKVFGDGSQTRTFCYIDDNTDAVYRIFKGGLYRNEVVNIGSDKEISILQLAETIKTLFQSESSIIHMEPLEEGDMTRRKPDNKKMIDVLERPLLPLEEGLNKSAMYFKERMNVRD